MVQIDNRNISFDLNFCFDYIRALYYKELYYKLFDPGLAIYD